MCSGLNVLVIEEEYLVALDMERILTMAKVQSTTLARSAAEAASLGAGRPPFDLAIVEMRYGDAPIGAFAHRLLEAGTRLVISSTDASLTAGLAEFPGVPVVSKPFTEADLLAACRAAMADKGPQ